MNDDCNDVTWKECKPVGATPFKVEGALVILSTRELHLPHVPKQNRKNQIPSNGRVKKKPQPGPRGAPEIWRPQKLTRTGILLRTSTLRMDLIICMIRLLLRSLLGGRSNLYDNGKVFLIFIISNNDPVVS